MACLCAAASEGEGTRANATAIGECGCAATYGNAMEYGSVLMQDLALDNNDERLDS